MGDEEWAIDGYGLRDHSWGPRFWQAPWYYRWLTANFGGDFGDSYRNAEPVSDEPAFDWSAPFDSSFDPFEQTALTD